MRISRLNSWFLIYHSWRSACVLKKVGFGMGIAREWIAGSRIIAQAFCKDKGHEGQRTHDNGRTMEDEGTEGKMNNAGCTMDKAQSSAPGTRLQCVANQCAGLIKRMRCRVRLQSERALDERFPA